MKKTFIVAFALMFGLVAQTQAVSTNANQGAKAGQADATAQAQTGNAVQTQEQNQVRNQGEEDQIQTQEQNTIQTKNEAKNNKGQATAESHRSTVATFVQSLLEVSDREGGIGQQVKVIAQEQNESKEKVAESIDEVTTRGKVKTFFFGSDYKNLGELRSEMVKTRNQIEQLKRLAEKAENEGDKTELQNQIQTLEQEQTSINNFITSNESKFSLFGWAVKLFQ